MHTTCKHCGGSLQEGQEFCTVCGTRRHDTPARNIPTQCTECGTELESNLRFCTRCGAPTQAAVQSSTQAPQLASQWTPDSCSARVQLLPNTFLRLLLSSR